VLFCFLIISSSARVVQNSNAYAETLIENVCIALEVIWQIWSK